LYGADYEKPHPEDLLYQLLSAADPDIADIDRHSKSSRHYQVVIGILTAKCLLYLILFLLYINKAL